jgi:hypothetical protein
MKNAIIIVGGVIAILGLVAFVFPVVSTQRTAEVARVGDIRLQTTERKTYEIPPLAAGGAVALGVILLGVGLARR